MKDLKQLIEQNYQSIKDRGMIDKQTTFDDFLIKLDEEMWELLDEYENTQKVNGEELADCILVLLNMARRYGIDIISELKMKVVINQQRAVNGL